MIDTHIAVLVLLHMDACCDVCHSEKIDDVADALASGDCYATTDGDVISGLFASRSGLRLLKSFPLMGEATA
jgi:hypothetical protein